MNKIKSKLTRKLLRGESLNLVEGFLLGGINAFAIDIRIPIKYITRGDKSFGSGTGVKNNIYKINNTYENLLAKFNGTIDDRFKEHSMYSYAKEDNEINQIIGNNIPESKGVFNVYNLTTGTFKKALVFEQLLDGQDLKKSDLSEEERSRCKKVAKRKRTKAAEKGFAVIDSDDNDTNFFYDKKQTKIYFIDPELWRISGAS